MNAHDDEIIINSLLNSKNLKSIIKNLVKSESKGIKSKESAIHKISELLHNTNLSDSNFVVSGKNASIIPINDLKNDKKHTEKEILSRCSLTSLFRLIDLEGWTRTIYNMISLRVSESSGFLVSPFGLLNHEITASSLIKIQDNGDIIDTGSTILKYNKQSWDLHHAIYKARSDVQCILQINLPEVVAISSLKKGLQPTSLEAFRLLNNEKFTGDGSLKYFQGSISQQLDKFLQQLGSSSKLIFWRNCGLIICAASISEAWLLVKTAVIACQNQIRLSQLCGKDSLTEFESDFDENYGSSNNNNIKDYNLEAELEFEAMMRLLDNSGYRTGYKFNQNLSSIIKSSSASLKSNVVNQKLDSVQICADGDVNGGDEDAGLVQICPMPPTPNGEYTDDIEAGDLTTSSQDHHHAEEMIKEEDDVEADDNKSHCDETDSMKERQLVKEICSEVIDYSVKYLQDE